MLVVKDSDRVYISESSSKGNQLKFYIDNKFSPEYKNFFPLFPLK